MRDRNGGILGTILAATAILTGTRRERDALVLGPRPRERIVDDEPRDFDLLLAPSRRRPPRGYFAPNYAPSIYSSRPRTEEDALARIDAAEAKRERRRLRDAANEAKRGAR